MDIIDRLLYQFRKFCSYSFSDIHAEQDIVHSSNDTVGMYICL